MGVFGGFSHCVTMCHPFVLLVATIKPTQTGYGMLIPQLKYNLGRSITYALLGLLLGQINLLPYQKPLTIAAGVMLLLIALMMLLNAHIKLSPPHIKLPTRRSPLIMGLLLGLLPCGFVLTALVAASGAGSAVGSMLHMALFGIGTSIALLLLALFGGAVLKYLPVARWAFLVVIIAKGVQLIYKA
jgi:sulfite exporter TauE/SafE